MCPMFEVSEVCKFSFFKSFEIFNENWFSLLFHLFHLHVRRMHDQVRRAETIIYSTWNHITTYTYLCIHIRDGELNVGTESN